MTRTSKKNPAQPDRPRFTTIGITMETREALKEAQRLLSTELGFKPNMAQTIQHLLHQRVTEPKP